MTKKNEEDKLFWRLSGLPTALEVRDLVTAGIITPEEAKDILFNTKEAKDSDDELKALKEQVEFLQGLIKTLSNRGNSVTYVPYKYEFTTPTPYWISTTKNLPGTILATMTTTSMGGGRTEITL